jgi:phospholipid transport system substrate-binding protein
MKFARNLVLSLCLFVFVFSSSLCFAEVSSMGFLKKNFDEIFSILQADSFKNKTDKDQLNLLYEKLDLTFDFRLISMLALGRNWRRFQPDQKNDFTKYFSRLITNVYFAKIKGQDLKNVKVDYQKAVKLRTKSQRSDVYTLLHHNNVETPVVYRMIKRKSKDWMVYDVLIEGVSLIANYRDSYREKSMVPPEKIINELKVKLENEKF